MSTPFATISLAGGCTFTGMNLAITFQTLREYGLKFSLKNDSDRQTVLLFVLAIQALSSAIGYPNVLPIIVQNLLTMSLFGCIQLGLVIINHNTIFRLRVAFPEKKIFRTILEYHRFLYMIPLFTLIPIYFAIATVDPLTMQINRSPYNAHYYKPLNVVLVIITESLAVFTDMKLLIRVGDVTFREFGEEDSYDSLKNPTSSSLAIKKDWAKVRKYNHKDLWFDYISIWIILSLDITLKLLITFGIPLLFDSAVSCLTMVLRASLNLRYDSLLRSMLEHPKKKNLDSTLPTEQPFQLPHVPKSTFQGESLQVSQAVGDFMDDFTLSRDFGQTSSVDSLPNFSSKSTGVDTL
ncbi:hypothetical protein BC833DRAFT_580994 [Globomyces pollinis-pini]|nr:hypothetical protein BC833DRAFT_580994 [Globomyces pollinis-pini]